jgi:hypothetical protein
MMNSSLLKRQLKNSKRLRKNLLLRDNNRLKISNSKDPRDRTATTISQEKTVSTEGATEVAAGAREEAAGATGAAEAVIEEATEIDLNTSSDSNTMKGAKEK